MCADGHAHADLARPFSHAHEHDVHDADAPDHERNAGNCAQQKRHDFGRLGRCLRNFLLGSNGEIVVATRPDVMSLSKQRDDLLLRRAHLRCIADLNIHATQRRSADHAFHRACVRHDHDVVLIDTLRT